VAAFDVVSGADVVVVVVGSVAEADEDEDEDEDEAVDEEDFEAGDDAVERPDVEVLAAVEWAVPSVATRTPSPVAESAAVTATAPVARRTLATARSRDGAPGWE